MPTISLNVDNLLTASVEIIAEAGDQLIVLGDAVIGDGRYPMYQVNKKPNAQG